MDNRESGDGGDQLRLVPSRAEDIAWAAGLFEGEGCWNAYKGNGQKIRVQARLAMTDEDVVDRFAKVVGFGSIRRNVIRRETDKPLTEWYTQRRSSVRELAQMFWPYLGDRRRARARELLDLGEVTPMAERTHCPQGHPYDEENLVVERRVVNGKVSFKRRCKICRTLGSRERARRRLGVTPDRYRV